MYIYVQKIWFEYKYTCTVKPLLGDLCHEQPPVLNDRFPRHRSFLIDRLIPAVNDYLPNVTSDHTKGSCDSCCQPPEHVLLSASSSLNTCIIDKRPPLLSDRFCWAGWAVAQDRFYCT